MNDLLNAIHNAPSFAALDDLSRLIWKEWGAQKLSDDLAQSLAEAIHARRGDMKAGGGAFARPTASPQRISCFPPKRRPPVSPDRLASITRRRTLAASGPMPPALAAKFTTGELAVMRIVADEVRDKKDCRLTIAAMAARAGVSVTTARRALRTAVQYGLLAIEERRRYLQPNLPNIVRILSSEWILWIRRGRNFSGKYENRPAQASQTPTMEGGRQKAKSTDIHYFRSQKTIRALPG